MRPVHLYQRPARLVYQPARRGPARGADTLIRMIWPIPQPAPHSAQRRTDTAHGPPHILSILILLLLSVSVYQRAPRPRGNPLIHMTDTEGPIMCIQGATVSASRAPRACRPIRSRRADTLGGADTGENGLVYRPCVSARAAPALALIHSPRRGVIPRLSTLGISRQDHSSARRERRRPLERRGVQHGEAVDP